MLFDGDYPALWRAGIIQQIVKELVGWRCEHCGMAFAPGSNQALSARNRNGRPAILTVHHLDGDKTNCHWTNLLVCCQACHLHVQATWRPGWHIPAEWGDPPEWLLMRSLPYRPPYIQMELPL